MTDKPKRAVARLASLSNRLSAAVSRIAPSAPGLPQAPEAPATEAGDGDSDADLGDENTLSTTVTLADVPDGCRAFVYGELMVDGTLVREESTAASRGETVTFEFSYDASEYEKAPVRVSVLTSTEIEHIRSESIDGDGDGDGDVDAIDCGDTETAE